MTNDSEVRIAGAGPTGLTLAIELARRGVSFRIVDAASRPSQCSRGKGLQPRTLEVFEDLGVLAAVQASGSLYPPFRVHLGPLSFAAGRINKILMPSASVPFPNLWLLPQWRTEEILRTRLEQLGNRVEFDATLTAFRQDPDFVTATIATAASIERVHADYLVGCDGWSQPCAQGTGRGIRRTGAAGEPGRAGGRRDRWPRLLALARLAFGQGVYPHALPTRRYLAIPARRAAVQAGRST
jgi:2-polyprenyl-6-methoxyphenol hydroxylase-like FAD-dependent oxidoreductase